ncbi:hypothetical protein C8Q80DRAFT_1123571 [Daedaleopsis nitida]|nr:hypothetical protein C8Q80DRAFT_1123571 [Daedaleopsis nitida]
MSFACSTLLALATFSQAVSASPLTLVDAASTLPVSDVRLVPANVNITFDTHGIHSDATVPSIIMACAAANCVSCSNIPLPTMFNTCLGLPSAISVAVTQQFNEALPYGVFVGPRGCTSFAQIPAINTCFNVINGPFTDFEVTEAVRGLDMEVTYQ